MSSMRTMMGMQMKLPLTERQKYVLEMLRHEEEVLVALGGPISTNAVHNMDQRRISKVQRRAADISQLRCAALRTILIEEEQRKPAR